MGSREPEARSDRAGRRVRTARTARSRGIRLRLHGAQERYSDYERLAAVFCAQRGDKIFGKEGNWKLRNEGAVPT